MTVNIDSLLIDGRFYNQVITTYKDNVLTVVAPLLFCDAEQDMNGKEVEGSYLPAWPIEGTSIFPRDIDWTNYEMMAYQIVGQLNGLDVTLYYNDNSGYVLRGFGFYQDSYEIAEYYEEYGWVPHPSKVHDGGLHILNQDIPNGYDYAWPVVCPLSLSEDGTEVEYRLPYAAGEPVWFMCNTEYMADGSVYIPVWDYIHNYSTKVPEELEAVIPAAMCLGLEAEFSEYTGAGVLATLSSVNNKALFKEDSSCGIELVTVPLLPKQMINLISNLEIAQLGVDSTCGVHIHVSRKYLTQFQLGGLVVFMNHPHNLKYIQQIAGRESNRFCKQVPGKQTTVSTDRYEMVNLTNSATVEIRIFAGTNDTEVLLGYVTWLLSLIEWLGTNPTNYSYQSFTQATHC